MKRRKDNRKSSAKLVWDTKPKQAPTLKNVELRVVEVVLPQHEESKKHTQLEL